MNEVSLQITFLPISYMYNESIINLNSSEQIVNGHCTEPPFNARVWLHHTTCTLGMREGVGGNKSG